MIKFIELRILINDCKEQFTGISRDNFCDFQDGIQYQFPYLFRCGQLENASGGFSEECSECLVGLKVLHSAKDIVLRIIDRLRENKANHGVFIYGCKSGGITLAKAIRMENPVRFTLRGFISDSDDLPGHILQGVMVYKNDANIIEYMRKQKAEAILVFPLKTDEFSKNEELKTALLRPNLRKCRLRTCCLAMRLR